MSGTELLVAIVFATIAAGTPLVLAALGELITERSGVLNLGVEGMMAVGAIAGFAATLHTGSAWFGVMAGMAAGTAMAMVFALVSLGLEANQVATGLALSIFGVGLSAFIGKNYESASLPAVAPLLLPGLSQLPVLGKALFSHQGIVYASWLLPLLLLWFLFRTKAGLLLRSVGESPTAAHALGYPVNRVRYLACAFGGALAGLGGTYLSVFYTPLWVEGMVAGRGWIALALVVFASWKVGRVLFGAYLFGGVLISQLFLQASGWNLSIPSQLLSALPYLATILVLVLISSRRGAHHLADEPAALGKTHPRSS